MISEARDNSGEVILRTWVVYDHPRDFPDYVIIRRQTVFRGGAITFDPKARMFRNLEAARAWCSRRGLYPVPCQPGDDPVIVETWI